jgi:LysM repeat protein
VTATVVDDDDTSATAHDDATVTFTDVLPGINVEKTPSAPIVVAGQSVTYTYKVTNTGDEPLANVTIDDNKCATVGFVNGDTNADEKLDLDETWTYSCTQALTATTTNIVTVTGEDNDGNTATDEDTATVAVIKPAIAVDKTANVVGATVGQTVTYTYVVTNPGDDPLSNVTVVDDKCSPVTFKSGDTDADTKLDVTETWTYTCSQVVNAAGALTNVVVVTGTPTTGPKVSATDTVTIPVVLGETLSRTGTDSARLATQALALVCLGAALVLLGRRRLGVAR